MTGGRASVYRRHGSIWSLIPSSPSPSRARSHARTTSLVRGKEAPPSTARTLLTSRRSRRSGIASPKRTAPGSRQRRGFERGQYDHIEHTGQETPHRGEIGPLLETSGPKPKHPTQPYPAARGAHDFGGAPPPAARSPAPPSPLPQ